MEDDRDDCFTPDFKTNEIPFGSKPKGKLSTMTGFHSISKKIKIYFYECMRLKKYCLENDSCLNCNTAKDMLTRIAKAIIVKIPLQMFRSTMTSMTHIVGAEKSISDSS